jgi:hypothetical protein
MTRFTTAVFAAIALAAPGPTFAEVKPAASHPLPSSYAPRPHSEQHVYGSPIEPRIVGHAQASYHKHATTKQPTGAATRDAHGHKATTSRSAPNAKRSRG